MQNNTKKHLSRYIIGLFTAVTLASLTGCNDSPSEEKEIAAVAVVEKCVGIDQVANTTCLEVEGRKSIIYEPTQPNGIAILLHGMPGYPDKVRKIFGAETLMDDYQLLTAIPKGLDSFWGWNSTVSEGNKDNDDVTYLTALIDQIQIDYNLNGKPVYIIGYSAGGFMAYKLACQIPERINGIVSIGGQIRGSAKQCDTSAPIAVHHLHNPEDSEVPVAGTSNLDSLDDTLDYWLLRNGCSGEFATKSVSGVTETANDAELVEYSDCVSPVKYSKLFGTPHEASYVSANILKHIDYLFDTK